MKKILILIGAACLVASFSYVSPVNRIAQWMQHAENEIKARDAERRNARILQAIEELKAEARKLKTEN